MKGLQSNTSNRHLYLYPENIKEVMGYSIYIKTWMSLISRNYGTKSFTWS